MRGSALRCLGPFVCGALGTSACTWEALRISLPDLNEGRAAAVALEIGAGGRLDRVESVSFFDRQNLEMPGVLPFDPVFGLEADARISLLEYTDGRGLEDFGYPSGEVARSPGISLAHFPAQVRELRVTEGEIGDWRARMNDELDGPLAEFQFADLQPGCACLTGKIFETTSSTSSTVFLARLGSERVVVGMEDGRLYWVRPNGLEDIPLNGRLPFTPRTNNDVNVGGGVGIGPNELFVTGRFGKFWRYVIDDREGLVEVMELGEWLEPRRVRWLLHVAPRIYALEEDGLFGYFDLESRTSVQLHLFEPMPPAFAHGVVAYADHEEASLREVVAGSVHSASLFRYRGGVSRLDSSIGSVESIGAAAYHPEFGWFVGTAATGLVHHEYERGVWQTCDSQLGISIGAMVPFRDGFIAGGTQGFIEQYSARDGWCAKLQPASNSIRFMVPYADGELSYVVTGPRLEERRQMYTTVTLLSVSNQADCDGIRNPGGDVRPTCRLVDPR